ncbi:hypothetical protein FGO68_gene15170 [Halteria grandinella]|uniref:Uncharacterized protein n=1 Tax=Halteria grandinella TaxID=5974 RepID=A0A8J8NNE8_HALGN|nr:hypothetical protein FGO68_gene15170 [Halteria grandinella]
MIQEYKVPNEPQFAWGNVIELSGEEKNCALKFYQTKESLHLMVIKNRGKNGFEVTSYIENRYNFSQLIASKRKHYYVGEYSMDMFQTAHLVKIKFKKNSNQRRPKVIIKPVSSIRCPDNCSVRHFTLPHDSLFKRGSCLSKIDFKHHSVSQIISYRKRNSTYQLLQQTKSIELIKIKGAEFIVAIRPAIDIIVINLRNMDIIFKHLREQSEQEDHQTTEQIIFGGNSKSSDAYDMIKFYVLKQTQTQNPIRGYVEQQFQETTHELKTKYLYL